MQGICSIPIGSVVKSWKLDALKRKREAAKQAAEHKVNARVAVKAISKVLAAMKESVRWQEDRKNIVRKALDVLAGEASS